MKDNDIIYIQQQIDALKYGIHSTMEFEKLTYKLMDIVSILQSILDCIKNDSHLQTIIIKKE